MHDFYLANEIVKIVKQNAQKNDLAKIHKIIIELGDIVEHGESISPENLVYNINLLLPGAEIKIKKIEGSIWRLKEIEGEKL